MERKIERKREGGGFVCSIFILEPQKLDSKLETLLETYKLEVFDANNNAIPASTGAQNVGQYH